MPNEAVFQQIEVAELIQSVDDGRAATDPFKLVAATRTELNTRLADLKAKDAATLMTEGDRAGASAAVSVIAAVPLTPGVTYDSARRPQLPRRRAGE